MKKVFFSLFLLSFSYSVFAQLGANLKYNYTTAENWNRIINHDLAEEANIFHNSYEYGLDYWVGMEYVRIEYHPEISYSKAETEVIGLTEDIRKYKQQTFSFTANTNFYVFNLSIDRPCPSSQVLNFLQKGFFIQLAPGVSYFMNEHDMGGEAISSQALALKLGAGIGFDIRLGDAVIITPYAKYNYYPGAKFEDLYEDHGYTLQDGFSNESKITQKQIGIRIGFVPKVLMRSRKFY